MASAPDYYISSDYSPYDDSSANGQQPQHNTPGDKFIVIAILIFFTVIFFLSTLHMCAKWLWRLRNRNPNFNGPRFHLAADDHHLQASAAGGLTKAAIALLPTFTYTAAPTAQPDLPCKDLSTPLLECAVCLSEFQENEKGRMLPACQHSFHIGCIDMWFYSHRTCPLCRTVVMADTVDKLVSPAGCIPAGAELQYRGHGDAGAVEASSSEEDRPANEMRIAMDTIVPSTSTSAPSPSTAASAALNSTTGIIVPPSTQQQQEASSSSSTRHSSARHLPHITIEIPTRQDISMTTSPGCISLPMQSAGGGSVNSPYVWSCTPPLDHSCSSHTPSLKSPSIRATLKKTLWSMPAASKGKSFLTSVAGILASPKAGAARRLPL